MGFWSVSGLGFYAQGSDHLENVFWCMDVHRAARCSYGNEISRSWDIQLVVCEGFSCCTSFPALGIVSCYISKPFWCVSVTVFLYDLCGFNFEFP